MKHFKLAEKNENEVIQTAKACLLIDYCEINDTGHSCFPIDICGSDSSGCIGIDICTGGDYSGGGCLFDFCGRDCFADAYYCGNVEFGPDGCVCNGDTCSGFDTCESDII